MNDGRHDLGSRNIQKLCTLGLYSSISMKDIDFYLYGRTAVLPVIVDETIPGVNRHKSKVKQVNTDPGIDILQLRYKPGVGEEFSSTEQFDKVIDMIKRLPGQIQLCYSSIPRAGFGICAKVVIASGSWLGPYEGKRISVHEMESSRHATNHTWEVYKNGKVDHYITADGTGQSHWMKYVQCARNANEQNTSVFQFGYDIYFQANKKIKPGEELLVWYADYYEKHFDIPIGERHIAKKDASRRASWVKGNKSAPYASTTLQEKQPPTKQNVVTTAVIPSIPTSITAISNQEPTPQPIITHTMSLLSQKYPVMNRYWKCESCETTFPQKLALKAHKCPLRGLETNFCKCTHCHKTFINKSDLEVHLKVCNKYGRYKCGYCARTFGCEENLTKHLRVHSRQKLFNGKARRGRMSNYEKFILAKQG